MDADGAKLGTAIPNTMQIELHDPTSEALIQKRMASGAYSSAEEVVRRALELLDAEESWTDEERDALYAKITRGLEQLDRGEGIPGEEARQRLQKQKAAWGDKHPASPR
jgi:antitoxin ParD1/3/4